MRQDVKLGLAVGGVLLAVLIVYVLVVPGSQQPGAELAVDESAAESVAGGPGRDDTADRSSRSAGETTPPRDETATNTEEDGDAVASNRPSAPGGFDWDKLLNGEAAGEIPSMSAETTVSTLQQPESLQTPQQPQPTDPVAADPSQPLEQTDAIEQEAAAGPGAPTQQEPEASNEPAIAQEPAGPSAPVISEAPVVQHDVVTPQPSSEQSQVVVQQPAPEVAAPVAPTPTRIYVIKPNETFSSIAAAVYGNPSFYPHIQRANPGIDPARLKPGMKINVPDVSAVKPTAITASSSSPGAAPFDPNNEYRVQPNDSLYRISVKLYGKSDRMNKLYELNKETIGEDPANVKPGMVLKLPEVPTVTASSR